MASFSIKVAAPVVFGVFAVVLQLPAAALAAEDLTGGKEQREFDYFVLALQWPGTSCRNISECCPNNGCCRGADTPTEFTIHGLWPHYGGKGWPTCCTSATFNENEISSLIEDINKYWPTYRCGLATSCNNRKGSFWALEYEKHGTCGSPVIVDEYDYFWTTLGLFFKYNVTEALEDAEILASDTTKYPIEDVIGAVRFAFKVTPRLTCGKKGIVKELQLCFYKDFKLRDCDATKSCPKSVWLPKLPDTQKSDMVKGAIRRKADAEAII